MRLNKLAVVSLCTLFVLGLGVRYVFSEPASPADVRAAADKAFKAGNWRDAYDGYKKRVLDPKNDAKETPSDLSFAVQCLQRLGRIQEFDELIEGAIKAHTENWRLQFVASQLYLSTEHHGYMIAGKFERGQHRGGGKMMNAFERDRVRAMQLMQQAMPIADKDDNKGEVANFYRQFADFLLYQRGYSEAWRLQYLTNLAELPDYEEGYYNYRYNQHAPVDEKGEPVFHTVPMSWKEAKTDGQRWRWCLAQAVEVSPNLLNSVRMQLAQFFQNQFGVQTMAQYGWAFRGQVSDDTKKNESGTYALHTLKEDETIAQLATGIKRFKLPDEFNYIRIYQKIADEPKTGYGDEALGQLASEFANRRQYPTAAKYWKRSIAEYKDPHGGKQKALDQIVGNWGLFDPIMTQPAGQGATLEFRFRNAKKVNFTAQSIKTDKLLDDVKAYLKSDPGQLNWSKMDVGNLGHRLVYENQKEYLTEDVAKWELELKPREDHFDRRITVSTPLQKAGAYMLTATLEDGNVSKIIVWVADTAIVHKTLSGKNYYFVSDAATGKPLPGATLEFFGYQQKHVTGNKYRINTTNFAEKTDANGQVFPDNKDLSTEYQWLVTARDAGGRLAYLGFNGVWTGSYYDAEYNEIKVFPITDRPVYRPSQPVKFKAWVRHAKYDQPDTSDFADKTYPVQIFNPKGEKVFDQVIKTDAFGGMEGEWKLPADATLGQYNIQYRIEDGGTVRAIGYGMFRVEEYKKPEFEVSIDSPTEPVMLGESVKGKIKAKYYFGSPVVKAKVKYTINRTTYNQSWYPVGAWDWFYGSGYWWYAYDAPWYPGWGEWCGCRRPWPWWWYGGRQDPPEMVSQQEVEIGKDGTVEFTIDTKVAKELHGDEDHQYTITAEVRDESRRTIVGTGKVLVARKPFKVFSWVDRGYYRVGDPVTASFSAQTLDGKPVQGMGELKLLKITYNEKNEPVETAVRRWEVGTNEEGLAKQQLMASAKGQYRLSYKLTDSKKHTIEGGYLFTIMGDGYDGKDYRFNNIEVIADKREYQAGEKVKLQINTDRTDSTVLLFLRPANGVYLAPQVIRLKGKSTVHEFEVGKKDMPNFFIEALTVSGGKVFTEAKELVVPPEKRVLNVEVTPSNKEYKPGQKATVKVRVTDFTGEPVVGSVVVSIYDKAVEYISGGSNVGDIKEFFWKWRRHHQSQGQTSLAKGSGNLSLRDKITWQPLGIFGNSVADELDESDELASLGDSDRLKDGGRSRGAGFGGGKGAPGAMRSMSPLAAAAPEAAMAKSEAMYDAAPMEKQSNMQGADKNQAADGKEREGGAGQGPTNVEPTVRSNFADTALWVGSINTDKTGMAEVALDMPENLSTWKINVWSLTHGTKVGSASQDVVTRKNLIVRMQAPRFFVQKDEVVLSANVHNYLKTDKTVTVVLELPEKLLKSMKNDLTQKITIPAGGEKRVDWRVAVIDEGEAKIRMKGLTDEESDAVEMKFPCYVHGMLKMDSWAGTVRPDQESGKVTYVVPKERRIEQSVLEVRYSPTLAGAMVDALPYLVDFPYGCTEQTLNRFLPTVVTHKTLLDMKLDLADIQKKRTNLNAQEIGEDTERAKQWKRYERNPVFDDEEVKRIVKEGLKQITSMQNSDGGWGWFSGYAERSWPHTTAVMVHGLQVAKDSDVTLVPGVLERGVAWLDAYQKQQVQAIKNAPSKTHPWKPKADNLDAMVFMVLTDGGVKNADMLEFLYRDRIDLAVYSKAMYGLALHKLGDKEKLDMILKNIEQFLVQDKENETAYLKLPEDNYWWYWYGSEIEANAYYLKLLSKVDAKGVAAPRLVKYLLNNRKHATYWNSTRDTALVVEAFAEYLRGSDEMNPDMTVEVWLDGKKRQETKIDRNNLFSFPNKFVLTGDGVLDGSHTVELRRTGKGPVYFNVYLTNFTLEDDIKKAGLEIKIERAYYKLEEVDATTKVAGQRGQALDQKVQKYKRIPLENLALLKSGDLVEVELAFESKNDYEYILFEDMKPAGFEPVDVRSGYTNNGLGAYMELRDNRVAFFVRWLARGKNSISYRMRAETPGKFSALPAKASAMYAPELKGNSDEIKLKVED